MADQITFSVSDDSWVNGNTSQQDDNYGGNTTMYIRHNNETWGNNYSMVKFDLTPLTSILEPGQSIQVTSARMRFWTSLASWPQDENLQNIPTNFSPVAIFKTLEDWDESTVVWTNAPACESSAVQIREYFGLDSTPIWFTGTNLIAAAGWLEYTDANVAELVESWLNGTVENYGVTIKATELVSTGRIFAPTTSEHSNPGVHPTIIVSYTIIEDETYAKVGASDDSWVNGNLQGDNYGSSTAMRIRYNNETWGNNYSMVKFDLSSITDALSEGDTVQVNSVKMRFYTDLLNWPGLTNFSPIAIYQNTGDWDESTVVWTNAPAIDSVALESLDYFGDAENPVGFTGDNKITSGGWLEYTGANVASIVEEWLNGTTENFGVSIKATEFIDSNRYFTPLAKEYTDEWLHPEMIINYTVIPAVAGPSQIISINQVSSNVFKMLVSTKSLYLSSQKVIGRTSLSDGGWEQIAHSDAAEGPFVSTNLLYSTEEGSNVAVYVESTNSMAFFGIQ